MLVVGRFVILLAMGLHLRHRRVVVLSLLLVEEVEVAVVVVAGCRPSSSPCTTLLGTSGLLSCSSREMLGIVWESWTMNSRCVLSKKCLEKSPCNQYMKRALDSGYNVDRASSWFEHRHSPVWRY